MCIHYECILWWCMCKTCDITMATNYQSLAMHFAKCLVGPLFQYCVPLDYSNSFWLELVVTVHLKAWCIFFIRCGWRTHDHDFFCEMGICFLWCIIKSVSCNSQMPLPGIKLKVKNHGATSIYLHLYKMITKLQTIHFRAIFVKEHFYSWFPSTTNNKHQPGL